MLSNPRTAIPISDTSMLSNTLAHILSSTVHQHPALPVPAESQHLAFSVTMVEVLLGGKSRESSVRLLAQPHYLESMVSNTAPGLTLKS